MEANTTFASQERFFSEVGAAAGTTFGHPSASGCFCPEVTLPRDTRAAFTDGEGALVEREFSGASFSESSPHEIRFLADIGTATSIPEQEKFLRVRQNTFDSKKKQRFFY